MFTDPVFLHDRLVSRAEASVPLTDRGFRYGDGLFETIRIRDAMPALWQYHRARLQTGLASLSIPSPAANLARAAAELITAHGIQDDILRIQLTRGSGGRGYLPDAQAVPLLLMEILPLGSIPATLRLWHSRWQRPLPESLPNAAKTSQGLSSILARLEAEEQKMDDALLTNVRGDVCELSSSALLWEQADGSIGCTDLRSGAVESVMLRVFRALLPEIQPSLLQLEALRDMRGLAACNAAWQCAVPVEVLAPHGWNWTGSAAFAARLNDILHSQWERLEITHRHDFLTEAADVR